MPSAECRDRNNNNVQCSVYNCACAAEAESAQQHQSQPVTIIISFRSLHECIGSGCCKFVKCIQFWFFAVFFFFVFLSHSAMQSSTALSRTHTHTQTHERQRRLTLTNTSASTPSNTNSNVALLARKTFCWIRAKNTMDASIFLHPILGLPIDGWMHGCALSTPLFLSRSVFIIIIIIISYIVVLCIWIYSSVYVQPSFTRNKHQKTNRMKWVKSDETTAFNYA